MAGLAQRGDESTDEVKETDGDGQSLTDQEKKEEETRA